VGLLLRALNEFRKDLSSIHGACLCDCEAVCSRGAEPSSHQGCGAAVQAHDRFSAFWFSVLCPINPNWLWHKRECLLGECSSYGVDTLNICPLELRSNQVIKWKSIGYEIIGHGEDGRDKKAPKVMYNKIAAREFFQYLKPKLKAFIRHNYFTQW
jgi:hypothetical protein